MNRSKAGIKRQLLFGRFDPGFDCAFTPVRNLTWGSLARGTRGAEIAETAMILPLLFMFVMGIFWMGQAFRTYGTIAHAARAGARAAVAPSCATCTPTGTGPAQSAQAAVQAALTAANVNINQLLPTSQWTAPMLCQCRSGSATCSAPVACDASGGVNNICVQENVQLTYPGPQGGMYTCGTSVSMRYQYQNWHFVIPLTTLDLGNIQFQGQAQMRLENQ